VSTVSPRSLVQDFVDLIVVRGVSRADVREDNISATTVSLAPTERKWDRLNTRSRGRATGFRYSATRAGQVLASDKPYNGNTPLIVTAGQQTREMVLCEPYLTNTDETVMPRPWVKWAYQPARAEDVPAAFMRAYAIAVQPPAGPVFLSIPLDDWDKPAWGPAVVRTVSHRVSPDTDRLRTFADRINRAQRPCWSTVPRLIAAAGGTPV
jgi:hypothetical protein